MIPAASALYSSVKQTWNTPRPVVDRLNLFDPRGVELDPCSNELSIVGAREEWRIERGEDGLARPWHSDHGPCFCNPEYEHLETWGAKMAREAERGVEVIGLIPSRTDTAAFHAHILRTCTALAFWRGRLEFLPGPQHIAQLDMFAAPEELELIAREQAANGAPFPACLPYWGVRPRAFLRAFVDGTPELPGACWGVVCR